MFLTLKPTRKGPRARGGPKMEEIGLKNAGPGAGRMGRGQCGASRRPSCLECRTKKLRCTGSGESCARCETQGIPCVFPPAASRKRARHNNPHKISDVIPSPDSLDADGPQPLFSLQPATIPVLSTADAISQLYNTVEQPGFASWGPVPEFTYPLPEVSDNHLDWTRFLPIDSTDSSPDVMAPDFSLQSQSASTATLPSPPQGYNPWSPSKTCSCITSTLQIVQGLDGDDYRLKTLCFDEVLKLQKWIIFHCLQPLNCSFCSTSLSAHTVILIICERLTETFTCISRRLAYTHIDSSSVITIAVPRYPAGEHEDKSLYPDLDDTPIPHLYDAETHQPAEHVVCNAAMFSPEFTEQYSNEEQYHMGRALAKLQATNFRKLLVRIRDAAEGNAARIAKVHAMEARLGQAVGRMEGAFDRILNCLVERATAPASIT